MNEVQDLEKRVAALEEKVKLLRQLLDTKVAVKESTFQEQGSRTDLGLPKRL